MPTPNADPWIPVADALPDPGVWVLAAYRNRHNQWRIVVGQFLTQYFAESDDDDGAARDYCEAEDTFYVAPGWYEQQDNWGEYSSIAIHEGEVSHWMPLPAVPA